MKVNSGKPRNPTLSTVFAILAVACGGLTVAMVFVGGAYAHVAMGVLILAAIVLLLLAGVNLAPTTSVGRHSNTPS